MILRGGGSSAVVGSPLASLGRGSSVLMRRLGWEAGGGGGGGASGWGAAGRRLRFFFFGAVLVLLDDDEEELLEEPSAARRAVAIVAYWPGTPPHAGHVPPLATYSWRLPGGHVPYATGRRTPGGCREG